MIRATPTKPAASPATPKRCNPLALEGPAQRRHDQRHRGGDDDGQRGLDPLHGDEVQAQIGRVLAQAEDDDRPRLRRASAASSGPSARASATAISPEMAKRTDSAIRGGAWATIIRAVAKAEDHSATKIRPIRMARGPCLVPTAADGRGRSPQLDRGAFGVMYAGETAIAAVAVPVGPGFNRNACGGAAATISLCQIVDPQVQHPLLVSREIVAVGCERRKDGRHRPLASRSPGRAGEMSKMALIPVGQGLGILRPKEDPADAGDTAPCAILRK